MDSPYSYTITGSSMVVIDRKNGRTYTVADNAPNYLTLKAAITTGDWDAVSANLEVRKSIENWSKGNFKFDGNKILFKGEEIPGALGQRIHAMAAKQESVDHLLKFWELLQKNPSMRSVEQLFAFLEHEGIPIGPNGYFRAYKGVKRNMTDRHSGTVDNKPGVVNEMPRNKISDDPREACHYGYHVGALTYAKNFASVVVVCEVSPEDVVCVPYDCTQQKMRVCRYRVVGLHNGDLLENTSYELEPELGTGAEIQPVGDEDDLETESAEEPGKTPAPREKKMKKPREHDKRVVLKVAKKYQEIHAMDMRGLMGKSVQDLREYATKVLSIVGASKIIGGKAALVKQILKSRKTFA